MSMLPANAHRCLEQPTPPKGYTADELERDNPYNAWMHDMSLETSEADARPVPKITLKVTDGVVMGVGVDMLRDMDKVFPSRPINATVTHAAVPGEVLGHGHPDWPADLTTYAERKAYQRGVADARRVDAEQMPTPRCSPPSVMRAMATVLRQSMCAACEPSSTGASCCRSAARTAFEDYEQAAAITDRALEALVDFVSRSTHWAEGGATRHDAILALELLGVWK